MRLGNMAGFGGLVRTLLVEPSDEGTVQYVSPGFQDLSWTVALPVHQVL